MLNKSKLHENDNIGTIKDAGVLLPTANKLKLLGVVRQLSCKFPAPVTADMKPCNLFHPRNYLVYMVSQRPQYVQNLQIQEIAHALTSNSVMPFSTGSPIFPGFIQRTQNVITIREVDELHFIAALVSLAANELVQHVE